MQAALVETVQAACPTPEASAAAALRKGHFHRARDVVDIALNRAPPPLEAKNLLLLRARAELALGLAAAAQHTTARILALVSDDADAQAHGLGAAAAAMLGQHAEARVGYEEAARRDPHCGAWRAGWAGALLELNQSALAEVEAERAIKLDGTNVDALLVLGRLALRQGRPEAAVAWLIGARRNDPRRADVRSTLGVAMAAAGDFAEGLQEYEWRHYLAGWNPRTFDIPVWDGAPIAGKRLLVWTEQGLGDSLQFVRFAAAAKQRGAYVIFHGEPRLVRLFRSCGGLDEVHSLHAQRPRADFHASLLSLPALLGERPELYASTIPYLHAETELIQTWRARLSKNGDLRPRVGLVWQGNPSFCDDERRSLALAHLAPLVREFSAQVQFLSLQQGFGQDQLQFLPRDAPVTDLGVELDGAVDAFVDTAAVIGLVDLILTTDTALAHLTGALGRPVWTLLSRVPDWRWGMTSETTLWYPTMRLFRQSPAADWPLVIEEMRHALRLWLASRSS